VSSGVQVSVVVVDEVVSKVVESEVEVEVEVLSVEPEVEVEVVSEVEVESEVELEVEVEVESEVEVVVVSVEVVVVSVEVVVESEVVVTSEDVDGAVAVASVPVSMLPVLVDDDGSVSVVAPPSGQAASRSDSDRQVEARIVLVVTGAAVQDKRTLAQRPHDVRVMESASSGHVECSQTTNPFIVGRAVKRYAFRRRTAGTRRR